MSEYKSGDVVVVTKAYPSVNDSEHKVGDILILKELLTDRSTYWYTFKDTSIGIFEANFRKVTKLEKALK